MIPLTLYVSGFLSYREPIDLDFTTFSLACIAGSNGAGKSSLLDAITWALFGQARKRDDSLINMASTMAEVCLTFEYEDNIYRIQRSKPRDKTGMLEFQILQNGDHRQGSWKTLSERTLRETEARILETLRLDYETFVNASFFLQGKADQFTQQRPGDRKRILASVLGLEVWETYQQRTKERRRRVENEIVTLEARLKEYAEELAEESQRKERLQTLEGDLKRISRQRTAQERTVEAARLTAAMLEEQARQLEAQRQTLQAAERRHADLEKRLVERNQEREEYTERLKHKERINAAYADWQAAREALATWDEVAARFRSEEKRLEGPRSEINAERARLQHELQTLENQARQVEGVRKEIESLQARRENIQVALAEAEAKLADRQRLQEEQQAAQQQKTTLETENVHLKDDMRKLDARRKQFQALEDAPCPTCAQPVLPEYRAKVIGDLESEGKPLGDRYRGNLETLKEVDEKLGDLGKLLGKLNQADAEVRSQTQILSQVTSRLELLEAQESEWSAKGEPRRVEVAAALETNNYALEAQRSLAQIEQELKEIGYDAAEHEQVRRREQQGRASEGDKRELEKAGAALAPLQREIANLQKDFSDQVEEVARQRDSFDRAAANLAAAQAQAPDLVQAERDLLDLEEKENKLRIELGAARQKVLVLEDLRVRSRALEAEREEKAARVSQYKQLERAFGKDGVPALLIEQALPQIEMRANEVLDRLSGGNMAVRFVTQSAYRDRRREDLRETLDIQISDSSGTRDYENYSGGEQFRVNFAIRLALAEVLAQRAGARLQTLVIDEGFGSQDTAGRQRLIEAINLVQDDFAKILVITHIDELKDAFPNRIEVEKTDHGSRVSVL